MPCSDYQSVGVNYRVQVAGVRRLRFQYPRFISGKVFEGFPVKGDDFTSFVVRLMTAIRQKAIQHVTIDAPLLHSNTCMLGHAD
jgi:hypothetical protein